MGFQSQAGVVGFRTQGAKGAYASPGSGGVFVRLQSGSLSGDRSLIIPDPEIGGNRDIADVYLGPLAFKGEYALYPRMDSIATLLNGACGEHGSSAAGAGSTLVGTHTITPVDSGSLPWLSVEENIGDDFDHYQYTDAKVNTFHLEADASGLLMAKCDLIALTGVGVPSASATASPQFDTGPMVVGTNIFATLDGTQLPAKSFSFDLNNNIEDNDFRLGSLFLGNAVEMRRECTAGFKIRPESKDIWRQAVYGDKTATVPGGRVTRSHLVITMQSYEFIGSTATVYSMSIDVSRAVIKPFATTPSGDSVIENDIELEFVRPITADPLFTATVVNHAATIA